jgi:hypothetical protein
MIFVYRKLYVFGGYTKPVCGYKPAVQIFNHDRNQTRPASNLCENKF